MEKARKRVIKDEKQKSKKDKLEKSQGITLIALVITIIVLLILVGVTIASITGENGILKRTTVAREKTLQAQAEEELNLAIMASKINQDGALDKENLREELEKLGISTDSILGDLPWILNYKGYDFKISKDETCNRLLTSAEVNAFIGQEVDYEVSEEVNEEVGSWRIFYASNKEMFLISSNTTKNGPIQFNDTDYSKYEDVFKTGYGETYNSMWRATNPTTLDERSKATAYLCDEKNWEEYVATNAPNGTYAVGSPTKELLVLSWNEAVKNGGANAPKMTAVWESGDVEIGGYFLAKPTALSHTIDPYPIQKDILDGLYNNGNNYWLASPARNNDYDMCTVLQDGYIWTGNRNADNFGVRPIVSIPMSNVEIKNGIVEIENN